MTLRRQAQRSCLATLSRRLPRLLSQRVGIRRRGEWVLDVETSNSACGTPHDRALIPGARRRLLGSTQVGWRCSPRLAANGAPWSGDMPTVRVAHPRLCIPLAVGCPQVLSGPPGRGDGPRNAVYGLWGGGGDPESRLLDFVKTADPFRLRAPFAHYEHTREFGAWTRYSKKIAPSL